MQDVVVYPLKNSFAYKNLLSSLSDAGNIQLNGLNSSGRVNILYSLFSDTKKQIVYVANSEYDAKNIYEELKGFLKDKVEYLGADNITFYSLDAKDRNSDALRLKVYYRLLGGESFVLITHPRALARKYIPPKMFLENTFDLKVGEVIDLEKISKNLVDIGYQRVNKVEGFGQFSVRGGILDIYTLLYEYPVRIELFDDEIDSIRLFDVYTQKSTEKKKKIKVTPSRDFIYPKDMENVLLKIKKDISDNTDQDILNHMDKISRREYFDGLENYIDFIYDSKEKSLFEYTSDDSFVFFDDYSRFKEVYKNILREFKENFSLNLERKTAIKTQGNLLFSLGDMEYIFSKKKSVYCSLLSKSFSDLGISHIVNMSSKDIPSYNGRVELLFEEVKRLRHRGYKILISVVGNDRAKNISKAMEDEGIDCIYSSNRNTEIKSGQVVVVSSSISSGFEYPEIKYIVISDKEISGNKRSGLRQKRKKKTNNSRKIDTFLDLSLGDYVVHENSGVGKYVGIEQISVNNIKKDYLKIIYRGDDILYVPIDQMDKVQKYIGSDAEKVRLNKLGGVEWSKAKKKVRKEIEDMTKELVDLYAKREAKKGYKFGKDTIWQSEFEDKFPFQETDDQLKAIKATKKDMESAKVMDRLVCGDVGYGKTEIAIRAAFKAVMDGKQVAILVPTTILAQQHYNTFSERFEEYPIRVEVLSRFRTPKQQKQIIEDAKKGMVDVLIGTHRIVSKDIEFPKLGLVVIDEEQRFGVKHKESLKKIKENVDVLTLSATPIPRTLHMSLSGIRDMSILEEPPLERYPVMTYVTEAKDSIIQDEIYREISRGGQVFFVYNRVEGIEEIAHRIQLLVPEARIGIAHGRMSSKELENTIISFLSREYDVLVCTTIIETGMDISNANTMIIYDADKMGLAQLYQLRGRVGRSTRQGYAYLMYERNKVLSEISEKRLKAIKEFTEFGSGFKVAMRDLEIRGAGDVLGAKQHGHMAVIGYDLYVKMLGEAISKIKGEPVEEEIDVEINLDVSAYIPSDYIEDELMKIEMYKKIATIDSKEDMYDVQEELEDRFSDIPRETQALLNIAYIKSLCKKMKIEKVRQVKNTIYLDPITKYETKKTNASDLLDELMDLLEVLVEKKDK